MGSADLAAAVDVAVLQQRLLAWYEVRRRSLPWRDSDDAYAVLVSEIMLQQTQVDRVVPAFQAFLDRFPTATALADASVADVVTAWRGLGYNRRAVALHAAARVIRDQHAGLVPRDLQALLGLPGVGPYTARAVRAFAFGLDDAPVDTNVRRVVLRALVGRSLAATALQATADAFVPRGQGRDWNAALMDLGSAHCSATPRCQTCPLLQDCRWRTRAGGPDPAAPPPRPAPSTPFVGSSRYHRGRLLDALRTGPVHRDAVGAAAHTADEDTGARVASALVADGLACWTGNELRLPG